MLKNLSHSGGRLAHDHRPVGLHDSEPKLAERNAAVIVDIPGRDKLRMEGGIMHAETRTV